MSTDPREVVDFSKMTWLQIVIVAITIGLNALDGFDVLAISFASPGIAGEWGVDQAALVNRRWRVVDRDRRIVDRSY